MEIIPSINCPDIDCVRDRVHAVEKFAKWVHLDVADACFTSHKTWNDPRGWESIWNPPVLEVHLMVEETEKWARKWLAAGAKRVIAHIETSSTDGLQRIAELARDRGATVMLATNPETPVEKLSPYFKSFREFEVLAVNPGPSGQKFLPLTLHKVEFLRRAVPDAIIEVDGGINKESGSRAKAAGANILVVGSYLFDATGNAARVFEDLSNI
jgi:ribulose-phosphate 3-epimerase